MKHSVCIIDDSIPASNYPDFIDDTKILGKSVLTFLLGNAEWTDENVKTLVSKISGDDANWYLSAFKNPSFFFNHVQDNILAPEIIIFDWDYDGKSDDSEDNLFKLLTTTYSIIYVYTGADKKNEVSTVLSSYRFKKFKHRLDVIKKGNVKSVENLLSAANDKYNKNFSYRFGKELKINAIKSIDEILIQISKLSLEDFVGIFGHKKGNKYEIPTIDLVSIISEKFKHQLLKQNFSNETESIKGTNDEKLVKNVWSYRLYHYPSDDVVRKGDIIFKKNSRNKTLFLVFSSDCHMNQFWNKNFGFISLIPLHKLTKNNKQIKDRFCANKADKLKNFGLTSLTNPKSLEGITILPCVKNNKGKYADYLLNPKEIFTVQIKLPEIDDIDNRKNNLSLLYEYWETYSGEERARISEPFLSPLIQFITENITGYGCPDFPDDLQKQIKKSFDDARK